MGPVNSNEFYVFNYDLSLRIGDKEENFNALGKYQLYGGNSTLFNDTSTTNGGQGSLDFYLGNQKTDTQGIYNIIFRPLFSGFGVTVVYNYKTSKLTAEYIQEEARVTIDNSSQNTFRVEYPDRSIIYTIIFRITKLDIYYLQLGSYSRVFIKDSREVNM